MVRWVREARVGEVRQSFEGKRRDVTGEAKRDHPPPLPVYRQTAPCLRPHPTCLNTSPAVLSSHATASVQVVKGKHNALRQSTRHSTSCTPLEGTEVKAAQRISIEGKLYMSSCYFAGYIKEA